MVPTRGFIQTPDGEKYLYVSHGYAMKLNEDGTKATSVPKIVYDGWSYPDDWVVECKCLESPKLFYKDGYYYMVSAQGGTSGPSTAHMSVVARARELLGPWENSPHNPLTHTYSADEKFWHQGHGTVFQAADSSWWTIYHGRLNGYPGLGRPTLLMPVSWTDDGWPVIKNGDPSDALLPMSAGEKVSHGLALSDDFRSEIPGTQWYFDNDQADRLQFGNGQLVINPPGEKTEVYQYAVNKSFEVTVKIESTSAERPAGLMVGDNGIATDSNSVFFVDAPAWRAAHSVYPVDPSGAVWLRIVNYRQDLSFFYSSDGQHWSKFSDAMRSVDSYRISLFAEGKGSVAFEDFKYQGLE